jgi:hypothetical protein
MRGAADGLGADRQLLATIGSWGDTLPTRRCWRISGNGTPVRRPKPGDGSGRRPHRRGAPALRPSESAGLFFVVRGVTEHQRAGRPLASISAAFASNSTAISCSFAAAVISHVTAIRLNCAAFSRRYAGSLCRGMHTQLARTRPVTMDSLNVMRNVSAGLRNVINSPVAFPQGRHFLRSSTTTESPGTV